MAHQSSEEGGGAFGVHLSICHERLSRAEGTNSCIHLSGDGCVEALTSSLLSTCSATAKWYFLFLLETNSLSISQIGRAAAADLRTAILI
jgi:hypothetical protein